jgi:hypothetical protein
LIYFLILVFWIERCVQPVCGKFLYRNGVGRGSYFYDWEIWISFDIPAFVVRSANSNGCAQPTNALINTLL